MASNLIVYQTKWGHITVLIVAAKKTSNLREHNYLV